MSISPDNLLEVTGVGFDYARPALRDISFKIKAGDFLAILGPNGSGKTTLLKIILGLLKPAGGRVLIGERDLHQVGRRDLARMIGYVPQEVSIRFPLTCLEFVLQGRYAQGRILGFESDEDISQAQRAMEITGTSGFASIPIGELSGGEKQRVMVARSLAGNPRLLLLDEPVANLDISHQVAVFEMVRDLAVRSGVAVIVVTHELNLAAEFARRILLLKAGRIQSSGTAREVMTRETLESVFETRLLVDTNPISNAPRVSIRSNASPGALP